MTSSTKLETHNFVALLPEKDQASAITHRTFFQCLLVWFLRYAIAQTRTHACTLADRNSPHPNWQQSKMFSILVCVCFDNLFGTE